MADIFAALPLTLAGVISTLISAIVAFIGLVIADKFIAHNIDAKRLLIIAIVALFVTPVAGSFLFAMVSLPAAIGAYALPLIVWIILSEILLSSDLMTKLKVAVVGYVVYLILTITVAPYLFAIIPF